MSELPLWYEDEHAVYVHAGLERDATGGWKHPRDAAPKPLLWMRERAFFKGYRGKRLCFGHTPIARARRSSARREGSVDVRGCAATSIGLDTGCGKGGFLSARRAARA